MKWQRFFSSGIAARVSAGWMAAGVGLGAFGAHGLKAVLAARPDGAEIWRTAVLYHLIHALAMFGIAGQGAGANRKAWVCLLAGSAAFSGSLYLLTTAGWRWLGPVTPLGGAFLMTGWVILALCPRNKAGG